MAGMPSGVSCVNSNLLRPEPEPAHDPTSVPTAPSSHRESVVAQLIGGWRDWRPTLISLPQALSEARVRFHEVARYSGAYTRRHNIDLKAVAAFNYGYGICDIVCFDGGRFDLPTMTELRRSCWKHSAPTARRLLTSWRGR